MKNLSPEVQQVVDRVVTDRAHFNHAEFFIRSHYGLPKASIKGLFVVADRLMVIHKADSSGKYIASDYLTGLKVPGVQCRLKKDVEPSVRAAFAKNKAMRWEGIDVVNCPSFLSGYTALQGYDVPDSGFFKGLRIYLETKGLRVVEK